MTSSRPTWLLDRLVRRGIDLVGVQSLEELTPTGEVAVEGRHADAGRPLLAAAQHSNEVRDDLTLEQILDMIVAVATIHGDPGYLEPILHTTIDGLRPPNHGGALYNDWW